MKRVIMILTAQCNLRCAYCFQSAPKSLKMQPDVLKAGIEVAFRATVPRTNLIFSGGEPLLEFEQIRAALEYVRDFRPAGKHIRYRISTNGLLLEPDVAEFLEEQQFRVQLSFDGIDTAQERRGAGTFATLDRLLDSLRTRQTNLWQHNLQIAMTVTPATVGHMAASVEYFLQKEARDLHVAPCITHVMGWESGHIQQLENQFSIISDISRDHLDRKGRVPVEFLRKVREDRRDQDHRPCDGLCGHTLVVDVDGQVYGCPFFAESCQEFRADSLMMNLTALRMGDVRDPGLAQRRKAAVQAARRLVPPDWETRRYSSYGKCCDCRYRALCFVCPVSIWSKPNDTDAFCVPDFICAFSQMTLKYRENFPCAPRADEDRFLLDAPEPIEALAAYLLARR